MRGLLDDPGSLDVDFDPTVALEELFRYLGDEPTQYGVPSLGLGTNVDGPSESSSPYCQPNAHNVHSSDTMSLLSSQKFDLSSLLDLSAHMSVPDVEMPMSAPPRNPTPPQSPFRQALSTPPSPMSTSEEEEKTNIPRHKRPAHKRAEVKRRGKIKVFK